jgi:hypothetical protein
MNKSNRNTFLTNKIDNCDHDYIKKSEQKGNVVYRETWLECKFCGCKRLPINYNFSTPEGFFRLWNWAKTQKKMWQDFGDYIYKEFNEKNSIYQINILEHFIEPDIFANELYNFLKEY